MLRFGVVDFDSSHSVEFTKRLNHKLCPEDQWVEGGQVVVGCSLPSAISEQQMIDRYINTFTKELGLPLVQKPEQMIGQIDAVLIESQDGSVHLERARPFLEARLPTFVDKPFTTSVASALELASLASKHGAPLFSSSSLRYAPEVVNFLAQKEQVGSVLGCDATSPASLHPRNPGLYHYGIHGVETLYTVMGPGCDTVWCVTREGAEVVVGRWKDGRIGTLRGIRKGSSTYAFTAFGEKAVRQVNIGTAYIYRELLKQIVRFARDGQTPLPVAETVEIVGFIEAALQSGQGGGEPRQVLPQPRG